ncbi:transcription termination factor 3, mitochondrial [Coccinella septempunctata]|uniref:transcription termination factor 3, mitochondrial n=1 Tax=Coccinella septempunctata TaxID=41139 RepID=UPI001D07A837|nr:transcription termination factor 3, mitochondrial [Coccinella septempunctata]
MLKSMKSLIKYEKVIRTGIRLLHEKTELQTTDKPAVNLHTVNKLSLEEAIKSLDEEQPKSVLEECKEDLSHVAPYLKPSFNFAAYVNNSETLQELLKLGVNLYEIEKIRDAPAYITSLKFEDDIKEHVIFLHNLGLSIDQIGNFITKNPFIFKEDLDNLKTRIAYLKFKKFSDESITRIISLNPSWLQFSTQEIDDKLGFLQNMFHLTGNEVRKVVTKQPKLISCSDNLLKVNIFAIKEEMGFNDHEMKIMFIDKPKIFMKRHENILKTFEYLQNTMGVTHDDIVKCPQILTYREHKLKERYMFLKKLNRVQFDPKKPNYTSLIMLVSQSDADFAVEVAKSSIQAYNEFLKTL